MTGPHDQDNDCDPAQGFSRLGKGIILNKKNHRTKLSAVMNMNTTRVQGTEALILTEGKN